MQVLIRSLIAAFRNLLVARVDPALLARDLAPEDASARATRGARRVASRRSCARCECSPKRCRWRAPAATRASSWRPRCCASSSPPRIRRLDGARRARRGARRSVSGPAAPRRPGKRRPSRRAPVAASRPAAATSPPPQAASAASARAPRRRRGLSLQKVRAAWQSIRSKVESERQPLRAPLSRAGDRSVDGNAVVLKLRERRRAPTSLREHVELIEAAIADVSGVPLKVTLRVERNRERKARRRRRRIRDGRRREPDDPDALFNYANERIRRTMNQAQLMAQVKKMQAEMTKAQEELANTVVTGSAAGGAVTRRGDVRSAREEREDRQGSGRSRRRRDARRSGRRRGQRRAGESERSVAEAHGLGDRRHAHSRLDVDAVVPSSGSVAGPVAALINEFSKLPTVGPKTAARLVFLFAQPPAQRSADAGRSDPRGQRPRALLLDLLFAHRRRPVRDLHRRAARRAQSSASSPKRRTSTRSSAPARSRAAITCSAA